MNSALVYVPEALRYVEVPLWPSLQNEGDLVKLMSLRPVLSLAALLCHMHHPKRREICLDCLYRAFSKFAGYNWKLDAAPGIRRMILEMKRRQ